MLFPRSVAVNGLPASPAKSHNQALLAEAMTTRICTRAPLSALLLAALLAGCATRPSGPAEIRSGSATEILSSFRSEQGFSTVSPDKTLEAAALQQARYMAASNKMEHDTGWGRDFASRMRDAGIETAAAENIAHGRMDTAKVFQMWENSPPHRRNMLDPRFAHFGLASATAKDGKRYWALVLGR